ncbi:unnamed protein product, partial [Scytosiphon promiscuus]
LPVAQGRFADAEPLHARSLAMLERRYGSDHPEVATALNNSAECLRSQVR